MPHASTELQNKEGHSKTRSAGIVGTLGKVLDSPQHEGYPVVLVSGIRPTLPMIQNCLGP